MANGNRIHAHLPTPRNGNIRAKLENMLYFIYFIRFYRQYGQAVFIFGKSFSTDLVQHGEKARRFGAQEKRGRYPFSLFLL
ncbi:MAG: hypothetical protein GY862_39570 [Gammaproteobacteria bacterium]|nr:hypothetical protein [Gammaproteobacteria bacterium]